MSMLRDIENWWAERPGRLREREAAAKSKLMAKAGLDLAEEEARLAEIVRLDAMCPNFKFAAQLIDSKGKVARLKKIIEQNSK
ncbi:MAG: hypothetical protein ACOYB3_01425 [Azonexus sp.]